MGATTRNRRRSIERHAQIDTGVLTCVHCGEIKPLSAFQPAPKRPSLRYQSWCRICTNAASRRRLHEDPTIPMNYRLRQVYGISLDEYNAMLVEQGGVCAICGEPETRRLRRTGEKTALAVDHNHETGEVRKLICHKCNVIVGFVERQPQLLDRLAEYLSIPLP